jgi:hypothetical protein
LGICTTETENNRKLNQNVPGAFEIKSMGHPVFETNLNISDVDSA